MSQMCNTCKQDQPQENFYLKDGIRLFKTCKTCVCAAKRAAPKKPRGFARLSPEAQEAIRTKVADRRQKLTDIAREHEISYANLTYWVRMGLIK